MISKLRMNRFSNGEDVLDGKETDQRVRIRTELISGSDSWSLLWFRLMVSALVQTLLWFRLMVSALVQTHGLCSGSDSWTLLWF